MNGIKDGIRASRILLAHETLESYTAQAETWFMSLQPQTEAEREVVLDVVDIRVRLGRIDSYNLQRINNATSHVFNASAEAYQLKRAEEAIMGFNLLVDIVESTIPTTGSFDGFILATRDIAGRVRNLAESEDVQVDGFAKFEVAFDKLEAESADKVSLDTFQALSAKAAGVVRGLHQLLPRIKERADAARLRIADEVAIGGDKEAKRLQRARKALEIQMRDTLTTLTMVKELRPAGSMSGSDVQGVQLDFWPMPAQGPRQEPARVKLVHQD
jgi:hypothetical protein